MSDAGATLPRAIAVKNPLPDAVVVLDGEILARVHQLVALADQCAPTDADSLAEANDVFADVDTLAKEISAHRLEITRPIDALKKQIIEAEREAVQPLTTAKDGLGKRLVACQRELQRIAEEAARKAREEAERKAREERERLERERQADIERRRAEREAEEQRRAQEAALFGADPEPMPEPEPEPPPVEQTVIIPETLPVEPVAPKAAATTATRMVPVIDDEAAVIAEACKNGGKIHGRPVLTVDKKAVEALLKAGCPVPGARLEEKTSIRSAGRR